VIQVRTTTFVFLSMHPARSPVLSPCNGVVRTPPDPLACSRLTHSRAQERKKKKEAKKPFILRLFLKLQERVLIGFDSEHTRTPPRGALLKDQQLGCASGIVWTQIDNTSSSKWLFSPLEKGEHRVSALFEAFLKRIEVGRRFQAAQTTPTHIYSNAGVRRSAVLVAFPK
jgi:hypothetical protein